MSADVKPADWRETGWLHIRTYCTCGAALYARSEPPAAAIAVAETFRKIHTGPGHEPCDAVRARRARARLRAATP